jgi:hypothetical protein
MRLLEATAMLDIPLVRTLHRDRRDPIFLFKLDNALDWVILSGLGLLVVGLVILMVGDAL